MFLSYLIKLLPEEPKQKLDLDGALKLEFYKLEKTFKGEITLIDAGGEYVPVKGQGKAVPEKKEPLEEVIEKINMLFGGQFTEADKVIITTLHDKLVGDKKLAKNARTSDLQLFSESIFPKVFDDVAQESYVEQTEAFTSMFEQKAKYTAIMAALAEMMYKEFNRP